MFNIFRGHQPPAFHELLRRTTLTILRCPLIALTSCNPSILQVTSPLRMKWRNASKPGMQNSHSRCQNWDSYIHTRECLRVLTGSKEHWTLSLKSLKLSSMVSERLALLMHLKLMHSRTLPVTRPSEVVSALCIQKTLYIYTTITLSIHIPWQSACCCHNEDIL